MNEIAEANKIIMIYPQTTTVKIHEFSSAGCWDFFGYTNDEDPS
jgi:ABC-type branched-subunit amino acid transport system substrate-binding protein